MRKRTLVVDYNSTACMIHETDMDNLLTKYGFEKIRVCTPMMYGMIRNPFANRIQWYGKVSPFKSLIIAFKVGVKSKYWLGRESIRIGWAIE